MAEWSKALVLGTSHFGGVGSNPTPVIFIFVLSNFSIICCMSISRILLCLLCTLRNNPIVLL